MINHYFFIKLILNFLKQYKPHITYSIFKIYFKPFRIREIATIFYDIGIKSTFKTIFHKNKLNKAIK